jgi:general stress protein 26
VYEDNREDSLRNLRELIKGIRVAMLVTRSGDGGLRARPMATREAEFDGTLWFFTAQASGKVTDLQQMPEVCVVYEDSAGHRFVSLSGRGEIVRDEGKARSLWSDAYREWFPKGVEDPDLVLLRVDVERGEYWDSPGMLGSVGKILAGFSGETIPGDDGASERMHGTVRL